LGKLTIDALEMNDLPVVMGCILFIALLFIVINILVDIIYVKLDPRIKLTS
jgi:peptide/nickel transport system permease protein